MNIEQRKVGSVDVLTPGGALVDEDGAAFARVLRERVEAPNARVVVCLRNVPYMDSEAIEALLDASDRLADRADVLKLASVPSTCREILEVTGTASQFRFFTEIQDAVRSFL
ncbi:MAG: anti-sigma factor antagonist [Planctomycetota bacterium]|nr:MAG: anti-sigma factor antagonist [Planctomycetota bacterium]